MRSKRVTEGAVLLFSIALKVAALTSIDCATAHSDLPLSIRAARTRPPTCARSPECTSFVGQRNLTIPLDIRIRIMAILGERSVGVVRQATTINNKGGHVVSKSESG